MDLLDYAPESHPNEGKNPAQHKSRTGFYLRSITACKTGGYACGCSGAFPCAKRAL